jgi:hypothetical protein
VFPKNTDFTGIEYNDTIYNMIKVQYKNVIHKNYLEYDVKDVHNVIIGNPPYYMTKYKYKSELLYGRNNMYVLFLIHSMNIIKDNGIIAFIIPRNFMNSSYYNKIRKEIYDNWSIIDFVTYDKDIFLDTKQKVFGLVIQKKRSYDNDKFVFIRSNQYYFVFDNSFLRGLSDFTTLNDLHCEVGVGSMVWKQANKSLFCSKGDVVMIYSSDITFDMKKYSDAKKEYRYVKDNNNFLDDPILVINRGYGNSNYKIKVGLLRDTKYQLENHVLYVKHPENNIAELKRIQKSLLSEDTSIFVNMLFGNNAINCFELRNIIPIYR